MFVRPEQITEIGKPDSELGRLRPVVPRQGESDVMTLKRRPQFPTQTCAKPTLRSVTKLSGTVELSQSEPLKR